LGKSYRVESADLDRFIREQKAVRRSLLWQHRFDRAMEVSQRAFRDYLVAQGYNPETLSDEEVERLLR